MQKAQNSRKIFALGETVLDIIFESGEVRASRPGGSMLNSAVCLGRAGQDVSLLSEIGNDQVAELIISFLQKNQVNTDGIHRYDKGKTPLAMAFLDEKGDASYDFYKMYPQQRLQFGIPEFSPNDILLFGSYFGIDPQIRNKIFSIVEQAKQSGCLIVYDPNFRKPHQHMLSKLKPFIIENINLADIIRASHEDLSIIFGQPEIHAIHANLAEKLMILTRAEGKVSLSGYGYREDFLAKKVKVKSTIGAGDSFNAGVIYGLLIEGINKQNIQHASPDQWQEIIGNAIAFSADTCASYDNYISESFAQTLLAKH